MSSIYGSYCIWIEIDPPETTFGESWYKALAKAKVELHFQKGNHFSEEFFFISSSWPEYYNVK